MAVPSLLLNAVTATGAGTAVDLGDTLENFGFRWRVTGAPNPVTVKLQGSVDNTNWYDTGLDNGGSQEGFGTTKNLSPGNQYHWRYLRANVTTLTGGSTPTVSAWLTVPIGEAVPAVGGTLFGNGFATPTIVGGVLTVPAGNSVINPLPETSTTDTVDSIVLSGVRQGDILICHVPATNTITFDDAVINLGAVTRAVAPGGTLGLVYDGTQWSEMFFTAATDNA